MFNLGFSVDSTGLVKLGLISLLLTSALRWQWTLDEIKQGVFKQRFLLDEELNLFLSEKLEPHQLSYARSTFYRLCPTPSNCGIVPPFIHYESRQMIAPKYSTATCVIYKNMSTIMTAIMCYLYDVLKYQRSVTDIVEDTYSRRFCKGKNEYASIRTLDSFRNTTTGAKLSWLNIIIVRDPLERFISGFVNKCLRETNRPNACYNCKGSIKCVLEKQYERLMGDAQKPSLVHTIEDAHFAPQTWHCELRHNLLNYKVIKYSGSNSDGMLNELEMVLKQQGVGQGVLNDIRSQVLHRRTFHQTYNTRKRIVYENHLRSSPHLMTLLVKMFYYDYILFGYSLPQIY